MLETLKKEPQHPLLSSDENHYSLLIVDEAETEIGSFEWKDNYNIKNVKTVLKLDSLEEADQSYPFLQLDRTPIFIVFDMTNIVLKTGSEQELVQFLQEYHPNE
ncbi:hypothetical protein PZE06_02840 [Robertmurraya sp. DFI.2.37]|uniref:hypothetical protein n=1 Tax=Robertmurraya sp. DFI.2.37 TaxID=3031819 RepID=UPI001244CD7F|nr:hypothetical protein [Robertmurraya sp. DFI.2.37]MDF1507114.1 hypothetical protein [Robertmurraya sp. DFI.2.37]